MPGAPDAIDFTVVREVIGAIPDGCWVSYGDVAAAAGAPRGAQALGQWLASNREDVPPKLYRVLNRDGEVSAGWTPALPHLPSSPAGVRDLLKKEGVNFDGTGRADPDARWRP